MFRLLLRKTRQMAIYSLHVRQATIHRCFEACMPESQYRRVSQSMLGAS